LLFVAICCRLKSTNIDVENTGQTKIPGTIRRQTGATVNKPPTYIKLHSMGNAGKAVQEKCRLCFFLPGGSCPRNCEVKLHSHGPHGGRDNYYCATRTETVSKIRPV